MFSISITNELNFQSKMNVPFYGSATSLISFLDQYQNYKMNAKVYTTYTSSVTAHNYNSFIIIFSPVDIIIVDIEYLVY